MCYSWLHLHELLCWLGDHYSTQPSPEQLSAPLCGYAERLHSSTAPQLHGFIFSSCSHLRQQGRQELCAALSHPLTSNAVSFLIPPCSPVSPLAGPRCELLSYYIWNPRPNCAAKNTPSNQIIVMWVDELFSAQYR